MTPVSVSDPVIAGWTIYRMPEWWRAVSDDDPRLAVEHTDPRMLERACAAVSRPPLPATLPGGDRG